MCRVIRFRSGVIAMLALLTASLLVSAQPVPAQPVPAQPGSVPEPPRAYLGVLFGPAEEGTAGIVVRQVTPDSPAAKSGLKMGDRIVKLDDQETQDGEAFFRTVKPKKPGDKLTLGIIRDGKEQSVTVILGDRPAQQGQQRPGFPGLPGTRRPAFLGVSTQPLTPELKKRLNVEVEAGAVVTEVMPNSPAALAGLKRDDVITDIADRPIKAPNDLRDAIKKAEPGKELAFQVIRGKEKLTVKAKLQESTFGGMPPTGEAWNPTIGMEAMRDQSRRIRELERRIEELEKRLRAVEKK